MFIVIKSLWIIPSIDAKILIFDLLEISIDFV